MKTVINAICSTNYQSQSFSYVISTPKLSRTTSTEIYTINIVIITLTCTRFVWDSHYQVVLLNKVHLTSFVKVLKCYLHVVHATWMWIYHRLYFKTWTLCILFFSAVNAILIYMPPPQEHLFFNPYTIYNFYPLLARGTVSSPLKNFWDQWFHSTGDLVTRCEFISRCKQRVDYITQHAGYGTLIITRAFEICSFGYQDCKPFLLYIEGFYQWTGNYF